MKVAMFKTALKESRCIVMCEWECDDRMDGSLDFVSVLSYDELVFRSCSVRLLQRSDEAVADTVTVNLVCMSLPC